MTWFESLYLAVLQGATEFLPVSSSGHLVVAGSLFGLDLDGPGRQAFFVLLHTASLLAVLGWFGRDIASILAGPGRNRLLRAVLVGCLPAAVIGIAVNLLGVDGMFETPWLVGAAWVATGVLLWFTQRAPDRTWRILDPAAPFPVGPLLLIGCAQAAALVPGMSRSGATIAAALLLGVQREESFRFSFYMAIPLILGAQLLEVRHLPAVLEVSSAGALVLAFVACFAISLACLAILQRVVLRKRLYWFTPYCLAAGFFTLAAFAISKNWPALGS